MPEFAPLKPAAQTSTPLSVVQNNSSNENLPAEHLSSTLISRETDPHAPIGPVQLRPWRVQTKLQVGSAHDPAEGEADNAAREVVYNKGVSGPVAGGGAPAAQAKPLVNRISRMVQREAVEEETAQGKLMRQAKEEEAQMKVMRAEDDEAQAKLQRAEDDDDAQAKLQRAEDDDDAQAKLQRAEDDDDAQAKLQRSAEDEREALGRAHPSGGGKDEWAEEEAAAQRIVMRSADEDAQMKVMRAEDDEEAQAKCMDCEKDAQREEDEDAQPKLQREEEEELHKKAAPATVNHKDGFTASPTTADKIQERKPLGEPLPAPLKSEMESGFGADFSNVKIHRDDASAQLNKDLKAKAFTTGENVFFGAGQFDPHTNQGKELIAHELTHTIQQGAVQEGKPQEGREPEGKAKEGAAPSNKGAQTVTTTPESQSTSSPAAENKLPSVAAPEKPKEAAPKDAEAMQDELDMADELDEDIPMSPQSPEEDPEFQDMLEDVGESADQQQVHPDAEDKASEVEDAAMLPEKDQEFQNDAGAQMEGMDEEGEKKKREPFTAKGFKDKLTKNLEELEKTLPKDEESAEEFKESDAIGGIKDGIAGDVAASKGAVTGGLEAASQPGDPPATGMPTQEGVPLKKDPTGKQPAGINPMAAIPKPKTDEEISMEAESKDLDVVMAENNVSETQLENSNEPKFQDGLEQKRTAQTEAANAPAEYRKQEEEKLEGAKILATQTSKAGFKGMFDARKGALGGVNAKQGQTEKTDEQMQAEINAKFEEIYNETKTKVETTLTTLSDTVDSYFEKEAESAKATFEENVEDKIDDIYGVTVIDDYLFGADTEAIEKVFVEEKAIFVKTMDGILDKIAQGIADALNFCVGVVKEGRKKTKDYYDSLDKKQQSLAKESYDNYNDQYTSLEDTVYEKEDELASSLADAYKDNVDSLREAFDTIKDKVAAGWIGAAFQAIWGIIKTILKLFEMLMQLLSAVVEAIQVILNDPIGFLMNLIDGVKLGLDNFVSNIKTHLITGLVEWLTGSLGGVGITIPKDLFSLPGIFSLAFQVMGLSWDYFRAKAVKKLGEPVVQGIELAVDIFQIVKKDGALGLWEYIKEKFQDLQATVMDAIRDMIITKVVEAGIKWIISLMNPASAFVKAVLMIIDIAKFFIERAADIIELVMAFIDGIRALAQGNIQGVAKLIEKALAKAIPILLGFLASLLGISGLTAKVTKIIGKIKGKVDKAINKVINKAFGMFKKKGGKGKDGKPVEEEVKGLTPADHKKHKEYVVSIEKELNAPPQKELSSFDDFYAYKKKQMANLEVKYNKKLTKKVNGKPIKTTITMGALAAEKKDDDLDINIKIAPNDATGKTSVKAKIFNRLNEADVVKEVNDVAKKQPSKTKLPTWAAVFACAGKHVKIEIGAQKGTKLTFGMAIGDNRREEFVTTIKNSLDLTYKSVALKYLAESKKSQETVRMEINKVAKSVVTSVWKRELIFIAPTEVIRNLPSAKFVVKNENLKELGTSVGKAKHSEIIKNSDGLLHGILQGELKKADLNDQVHHTVSLYLGGDHHINNLLTLFGPAGNYKTPHGMMHELVDKTNITKFLNSSEAVKMDYKSLSKHYSPDKLKVMIGVLATDGKVKYKDSKKKI